MVHTTCTPSTHYADTVSASHSPKISIINISPPLLARPRIMSIHGMRLLSPLFRLRQRSPTRTLDAERAQKPISKKGLALKMKRATTVSAILVPAKCSRALAAPTTRLRSHPRRLQQSEASLGLGSTTIRLQRIGALCLTEGANI